MFFRKIAAAALLAAWGAPRVQAWDADVTFFPNASISYRGEGKVIPESYVGRFDGETSPAYRVQLTQTPADGGYWQASFFHAGVFGGGNYARERVPDNQTGGVYQTNQLNVGFTNLAVIYRRPIGVSSVEGLAGFSIVRQIFKRKDFIVDGVDLRPMGLDDVNEISAEGLGLGLAGTHGRKWYWRWQTMAHYYVQIFDAQTDASAGHIYQAEGGAGRKISQTTKIEVGALWQYWFILGQGNRRIYAPGTRGAVISWNRQSTVFSGTYVRLSRRFE
jgi:hypothetical protein